MTSTSRSMTMYSDLRAANLPANWELVRSRYESQPVSFGWNTLVGTAGVALAGLAKARQAARVARMRAIRADIVSSLDVDVRSTGVPPVSYARRRGILTARRMIRASEPPGEAQARDHAVADRRGKARRGLFWPPAQRRDLRSRLRRAAQPGQEDAHPHLDALERGRRAHL